MKPGLFLLEGEKMNGLMIFENSQFGAVRTVEENGKVLFCGSDITRALGYKNSSKAISDHCKGVTKRYTPTVGGQQEMNFITEGDIYRLAAKSELSGAEEFERWIFDEVLPSVRKHGMYAIDTLLDNPDLLIEAATRLKEERARSKQLAAEKEQLQIRLDSSKDWYSIKRVAALNAVSWKNFDWRKLKRVGGTLGYEVRKIFDANYGEVNVYHKSVWEAVYPQYEL